MQTIRPSMTPVTIVGAGPYGLSLAAHLRAAEVPFRIFGEPMHTWRTEMPVGMMLKSDGFASDIAAPEPHTFTLEAFCREAGLPYHPTDIPVSLEVFVAYGEAFALRMVPSLDKRRVSQIDQDRNGYCITIEGGEKFCTSHVVLATGLTSFQHVPSMLRHLPAGMVSHTSSHRTFESFAGKNVVVLGRGASSLNAAAILAESGAHVTLISRHPKVRIHSDGVGQERSLYQRVRKPITPIGAGLRSAMAASFPQVFHKLPYVLRRGLMYKHLGPSGGKSLQGRIAGKMDVLAGWAITHAVSGEGPQSSASITVRNAAGEERVIAADHIIAGTGFRYNMARLRFLSNELVRQLRTDKTGAPTLTSRFESSVRGLYFVGPAAATSFGQLLRFVAGTGFTSARVARHLERSVRKQKPVLLPAAAARKPQRA